MTCTGVCRWELFSGGWEIITANCSTGCACIDDTGDPDLTFIDDQGNVISRPDINTFAKELANKKMNVQVPPALFQKSAEKLYSNGRIQEHELDAVKNATPGHTVDMPCLAVP